MPDGRRPGEPVDPAEVARRCAAAMYADDLASQAAGIAIPEVMPGRATARMQVTPEMINGHGVCHGGYVFLLADTAFAFACNTRGEATVAQACDIVFLRPARLDEHLVAEAVQRIRYGRNGICDVTVSGAAGAVVAEFRGHSRGLGRPLLDADPAVEPLPTDAQDGTLPP
jgi:acyl-CoA thioesterase